jgi:transcriptional regulator of acetoin/glycerol metabolism
VLTLVERDAIVKALEDAGGNITRAANLLGIFRTVLQRKMERLGLRTATAARSSADSLPVP